MAPPMQSRFPRRLLLPTLPLLLAIASPAQSWPDAAVLERLLERPALKLEAEGVLHFYSWRPNLEITWQQHPVEVFEGISLRTSFQKPGDECTVAGTWLLFADETIPVVTALASGGLRIASVLPRFVGATPQPFELRFFGEGGEQELGSAIAAAQHALMAVRTAAPQPPKALTTPPAGLSTITERPLEDLFGCKSEVKNGVVLFRFAGPRGLAGGKPSTRMGVDLKFAVVGKDEVAGARLEWALERRNLRKVLPSLAAHGYWLESLAAATPAIDDELVLVNLCGSGRAIDVAGAVKELLDDEAKTTALAVAVQAAFEPPALPEALGIAGGRLADGWRSDATLPAGKQRARWQFDAVDDRRFHMVDPGDWDSRTFNLLWTDRVRFQDGRLVLRMRADKGRVDQGGGLIWRVLDANNYYVTRFNPLEQDFRVYRVKDGVREQIQALGELPYRSTEWFTIEVEMRGDHITCVLNGREKLDVHDSTFAAAGGIGVWSKADSQCSLGGVYVELGGERR
jgi:hypothetical protein